MTSGTTSAAGADRSKGMAPKATTPLAATPTWSSQGMEATAAEASRRSRSESRPWGSGMASAVPRPTRTRRSAWNTMPVGPARANGSTGGPPSSGSRTATGEGESLLMVGRRGWR